MPSRRSNSPSSPRLQASAWSKIRFFCSAVNFRRWRRSFSSRGTTSLVLDLGLGTVGLSSPPGLVHLSSGGECLSCYWHRGNAQLVEQGIKLTNASQCVKNLQTAKRIFKVSGGFRISKDGEAHLKTLRKESESPGT